MLVRNYGLFWKAADVYWGKQNSLGHLKGVLTGNTTAEPVDFRDQQGVYVLYDDNFRLVYVGQTGVNNQRLFTRLKQHTKDHLAERWSKFSWYGIRYVRNDGQLASEPRSRLVSTPQALDYIEAILISAAEPAYNRQGGRFGEHAEQYLQFRDDEFLGPTLDEMITDLWQAHGATKS